MLTPKQRELLIFINRHLIETGVSPSFEEMRIAFNLRSKSGIHRLVTALEERGFIRRLPNKVRALEIVRLPPEESPIYAMGAGGSVSFRPDVIEGGLGKVVRIPSNDHYPDTITVPIMGRISSGTPVSAIKDQSKTITVPSDMLPIGEHFALELCDNSLKDAGIISGDMVVIHKTIKVSTGDIVLAFIDAKEVVLRKLRHRKGGALALEAANDHFKTRIFGQERINVIGKIIGLLRFY